jgi:hypothetical protein
MTKYRRASHARKRSRFARGTPKHAVRTASQVTADGAVTNHLHILNRVAVLELADGISAADGRHSDLIMGWALRFKAARGPQRQHRFQQSRSHPRERVEQRGHHRDWPDDRFASEAGPRRSGATQNPADAARLWSLADLHSWPEFNVYNASKAYVVSFSQALQGGIERNPADWYLIKLYASCNATETALIDEDRRACLSGMC